LVKRINYTKKSFGNMGSGKRPRLKKERVSVVNAKKKLFSSS
jgi:hypothetical protein